MHLLLVGGEFPSSELVGLIDPIVRVLQRALACISLERLQLRLAEAYMVLASRFGLASGLVLQQVLKLALVWRYCHFVWR